MRAPLDNADLNHDAFRGIEVDSYWCVSVSSWGDTEGKRIKNETASILRLVVVVMVSVTLLLNRGYLYGSSLTL